MSETGKYEILEIENEVKIINDDIERVKSAFKQMNRFKNEQIRITDIKFLWKKAKILQDSIKTFLGWFDYWEKRNWK